MSLQASQQKRRGTESRLSVGGQLLSNICRDSGSGGAYSRVMLGQATLAIRS